MNRPFKFTGRIRSFKFAFMGIWTMLKTQRLVKHSKDVAAGAVLISAVGAAVIGLLVFVPYVVEWIKRG